MICISFEAIKMIALKKYIWEALSTFSYVQGLNYTGGMRNWPYPMDQIEIFIISNIQNESTAGWAGCKEALIMMYVHDCGIYSQEQMYQPKQLNMTHSSKMHYLRSWWSHRLCFSDKL